MVQTFGRAEQSLIEFDNSLSISRRGGHNERNKASMLSLLFETDGLALMSDDSLLDSVHFQIKERRKMNLQR